MVFLEISQKSQENTCARVSFLINLQALTLALLFSCELCETSKNTYFYRTPPVAASVFNFTNTLGLGLAISQQFVTSAKNNAA